MADNFTVDADTAALLEAWDALAVDVSAQINDAAKVTADAIAREAVARVARRTGETARGIGVEPATKGIGWVVFADRQSMPGLPGWLEFGTKFMVARPFLFSSARLEEGAHDRRMRAAIQQAIDDAGWK